MDDTRLVRLFSAALALATAAVFAPATAQADYADFAGHPEHAGHDHAAYADATVSSAYVVVPMVFPVLGPTSYSDTFLACRSGCARRHFGQDLMGPKMRPVVATFDGRISSLRRETTVGGGNYLTITGDNGWSTNYIHLNNDTPGTDDGRGTARYAFAPGLDVGDRVFEGQLLGWAGDSGNAENTAPHLHFELRRGGPWDGTVYNAKPSLDRARRLTAPRTGGPHPDGVLIRSGGAGYPVWLLEAGRRRVVRSGVFAARGYRSDQVVWVTPNEERWYRTSPPLPLPDGQVYRQPDGLLWLVVGGQRVAVPSPAAVGVAPERVRAADLDTLRTTPVQATPAGEEAPPLPGVVREGALLRADGALYLVAGGVRRLVPDAATLVSHGLHGADAVDLPPDAEVPVGPPLTLRDGLLVANRIGRLFVVTGGQRRYLAPDVRRYFGWDRVPAQQPGELALNRLPLGPPLP